MPGTPMQVEGVLLGDSPGALYVVPDDHRLVVKSMALCNLDAAPQAVSVYSVPDGGAADVDNAIIYQASLVAGANAHLPMTSVLEGGDQIVAGAAAAGVVAFTASGILYEADDEPTPTVLHRGVSSSTPAAVYTCPAGATTIVKHLSVCNLTAADRWVSLYFVSDGAVLGDQHSVIRQKAVPSRSTLFEAMTAVLTPGDSIYAEASADAALCLVLSGVSA